MQDAHKVFELCGSWGSREACWWRRQWLCGSCGVHTTCVLQWQFDQVVRYRL